MMVEKSSFLEVIVEDLNRVSSAIENLNQQQSPSGGKIQQAIETLHQFNQDCSTGQKSLNANTVETNWIEKEMQHAIDQATNAVNLFISQRSDKNGARQKMAGEAIVSLFFSNLTKEIKSFNENVKKLRSFKSGQKVENVKKISKRMRPHQDDEESFLF